MNSSTEAGLEPLRAASSAERIELKERRRRRRVYLWLFAAAFLVRLLFFYQYGQSAFFNVPILDEAFYDGAAKALVEGADLSRVNPSFRPLAYPAFLSIFYRGFGDWGYVAALLFQHLLGCLTVLLVADLARRLFQSVPAGACAGALYLLAAPPLFFESQLLNTTSITFAVTVLLTVLCSARLATGAPWHRELLPWAGAGMILGLAAQARPNVLPVFLALVAMALWNPWRARLGRRLAAVGVAAAGLLGVLTLAAAWQQPHLQSFHLLPTSGGVNFYLGNKADADGMIPRQDQHASYGDRYQDSVQLFSEQVYAQETGRTPPFDPRAVSRFWYVKTLKHIATHPLDALGLFVRKGFLLLWNHEIPNNKSFHFMVEHETQWLAYSPIRWASLLGLAVFGWAWARRRGQTEHLAWVGLVLALYGAGLLLFFVNARYRIPLWPGLAVLAGGGLWWILRATSARYRDSTTPVIAKKIWVLGLGLSLLSAVNWLAADPETPYRDFFFRSLAHQHKGHLEKAQADAARAVELAPWDAAAQFQLGTLSLQLDDLKQAQRHLSIATRLLPSEPRVFNNLGIVKEKQSDYSSALMAYMKASEIGPGFSAAWVNRSLIELRAGELDPAEAHIRHAERLGDRSVPLQCARAFLEIKKGRIEVGQAILKGAMARDPELTQRLVQDHRRALQLEIHTIRPDPQDGPEQ